MIELRTLGSIDLRSPGRMPVVRVLAQPKRLAFLAYLAAARPPGFHPRDTLLALFWPDLDVDHARAALRNTLHFLRRELSPDLLTTRGNSVALSGDVLWCDAVAFEDALGARASERALPLYRGELLPGLHVARAPEFERWLDAERDRLRGLAHEAAAALAHAAELAGNGAGAAHWLRVALALRFDDEHSLRSLIRLLAGSGDRTGALREYERFARRIDVELELEPAAETQALIADIRQRAVVGTGAQRVPRKSIVILPFESAGSAVQDDHLSDGLTEEIIVRLSAVRDLRVISRASAMRLKEGDRDIRAIGRDLDVQYAVDGTVRCEGDRLRVVLRLTDVATEAIIWADRYDGFLDGLLEIQERVARTIAEKLELQLTTGVDAPGPAPRLQNRHAYECYHRAVHELSQYTEEGLARAVRHVRNGLELMGENELLLSTMAYVYIQYLELGVKPDARYLEQAEEYANRALRVCPDSCPAHVARGMIHFKSGAIELAVPDLKRALQTDPTHRDALFWLALIYLIAGREAAAEPLLERLLEIDPLTAVNHCLPGYAEFLRGKIEDAIPAYRRMLELDPVSPATRWFLTLVLARCGQDTESLQLLDDLIRDTPHTTFARHARFLSGALRGDRQAALAAVTPQLLAEARWDEHASWWMASTYALIDERPAAIDWLGNATRLGYINYPFLCQHDPFLDSLRGDGRFWVLMEAVKARWERFVP